MTYCIVCAAMGVRRQIDEQLARGNGWCTEYEGNTYCQDSEEHHRMFERDPARFIREAEERGMGAA